MNILLVCACGSSTSVVLQKMKENGPVETIFGTLIWKGYPIQELSPSVLEFRLYNSLAVTVYWNESDSFALELLYG